MEYLRLDRSYVGGINANQTLMIIIAAVSTMWIVWRHRKRLFQGKNHVEDISSDDRE
jgi:hypothetical protein